MGLSQLDGAAQQSPRASPAQVTQAHAAVALRTAMQASLQGESPGWDLRRALRTLCDVAHRENLQVEQLLTVLRHAWRSLPEVRELPGGRERDSLLARVVSTCIEEFYAAQDATRVTDGMVRRV